MTARISDELLIAFIHGELAEADIRRVELALGEDPALQARIEALADQDEALRSAFAPIFDQPVPAHLIATVQETDPAGNVVDLAAARERKANRRSSWGWPQQGAIAASLVVGLLLGWQVNQGSATGAGSLVIATDAGPRLAPGLETTLATARSGEARSIASIGSASVIISFMNADGALCRQFAVAAKAGTIDGVACREAERWRMHAVGLRAGARGEMRTASGDAAPAVLATVDGLIKGEPLDAESEARALSER